MSVDPIIIGVKCERAGIGSKVELFAAIRREARVEGSSIRELARRHHVARKTVRKALNSAVPPERKTPERSSHSLDPFFGAQVELALIGPVLGDVGQPQLIRSRRTNPGP
ncbi:hypothetical protein [Arthrobacter sp. H16F315]|uniref:hypothetical protein n=1 Tax=Arthrobacter sp. H16F315 TaxID=2955314 RepID=UPI00209704E2|nr:hypothetical protein [Arthrobacter sp. H16F315]MDD1477895.1 hypothetical protein [Arthrobacter sp. H16F315]